MAARQGRLAQLTFGLHPPFFQRPELFRRASQAQLLDIIIGIADLVHDGQRDQQIRRKDAVHVGVQVGAELAVAGNVGLDDGLADAQAVVLRLAHQRLGDGRHRGLQLHPAVWPDVGHLRVPQAKYVQPSVVAVVVAGHLAPDHLQAVFVLAGLKPAQPRQVGDQVARMVVGRANHVQQPLALHVQLHDDVLFPVQIEALEKDHAAPPLSPTARSVSNRSHFTTFLPQCPSTDVIRRERQNLVMIHLQNRHNGVI